MRAASNTAPGSVISASLLRCCARGPQRGPTQQIMAHSRTGQSQVRTRRTGKTSRNQSYTCQNPRCWRESNHRANAREYAHRRDLVRGALTDTRGPRGRARAVRDAARAGVEISQAVRAGIRPVHLEQIALFPDLVDDGG